LAPIRVVRARNVVLVRGDVALALTLGFRLRAAAPDPHLPAVGVAEHLPHQASTVDWASVSELIAMARISRPTPIQKVCMFMAP